MSDQNVPLPDDVIERVRAINEDDIPERVLAEVSIADLAHVLNFIQKTNDLIRSINQEAQIVPPILVDVAIQQINVVCKRVADDALRAVDAAVLEKNSNV